MTLSINTYQLSECKSIFSSLLFIWLFNEHNHKFLLVQHNYNYRVLKVDAAEIIFLQDSESSFYN